MIWTLNLQNMLEISLPFFISKKPGGIPIFGTFLAKKSILAYISLKIDIFRSAILYYVIVTSYFDRFSWFWYQWKEETLPYTMVPNNCTLGMSISNSQEGGNHSPLRKTCYKKDSGRRGLNWRLQEILWHGWNFTAHRCCVYMLSDKKHPIMKHKEVIVSA